MIFSFVSGIYYNIDNLIHGYIGAQDKTRALKCLVPYVQVYLLIWLGTYSRFYEQATLLFFAGLGLFQTYVAGLLNISSTAKIEFQYLYWEPIAYAIILYLDATRVIQSDMVVIGLYAALVTIIFVKYCLFLESMISQLTRYLGIKLLRVKDVSPTKKE